MRVPVSGFSAALAIVAFALLGACGPASSFEIGSSRSALATSATYQDITVTIDVPDTIEPDTQFPVTVSGALSGGTGWSVTAWSLWENADWYYNAYHMVRVRSGTLIASQGFNWGANFTRTFPLTRPAGTYTYTFVFGDRHTGHFFYDVAVDATAEVVREPVVCDMSWQHPLDKHHKAGNTVPLKFTAFACATGQFLHDEGARVDVYAPDGTLLASWSYTGNPSTGVNIVDVDELYQVNWKTPKAPLGDYSVVVTFSSGDQLTGTITLE